MLNQDTFNEKKQSRPETGHWADNCGRIAAVARPGIDETERQMILDAAAQAGFEVAFVGEANSGSVPESAIGESEDSGASTCGSGSGLGIRSDRTIPPELLRAEVIYGEGPAVSAAAARSDQLRWLCASFAGVDEFCRPGAFKKEDVILTNSAGAYGVSLAEHAITLALMMMRRIPEFCEGIRTRTWLVPLPQSGIKDARVTLLGTGDAGRSLARRLKGFEPACITGVCRSGRCAEPALDAVVTTDRLAEVLRETDLLIISLPGTPETYHMIDEEMLAALPSTAYLVNVGRGSVIDEEALISALRGGRLAGAALDVLETEPPLPDSPLWDAPNLLLTPHVAGNLTMEYTRRRNTEMFCEDLVRYGRGEPLLHEVDRRRGY